MALALCALALRPAGTALAHDGQPPAPHDLWATWTLEPTLLLGLGLGAWLYARGLLALWRRAGVGRGIRRWQALAFAAGALALCVALVSPLDALSDALFSAHMAQHVLLTIVAAPLLLLGRPLVTFAWALGQGARRQPVSRSLQGIAKGTRAAAALPLAVALHTAALWVWHAPPLYEAALGSELVHWAEHASFFGTALFVWWVILHPPGRHYLASVLALFVLTLQGGLLGALLTFAREPWYPAYADLTGAWGLTPLEDQQLAGVSMWLPAGIAYLLAALALLAARLGHAEQPSQATTWPIAVARREKG